MKKHPQRIILVLVLALAINGADAFAQQAGSIRGALIDQDFDAPLPGVRVLIVETGQAAETTDQGNYVLTEVEPGTYTLVFTKDGYTRAVRANVVVQPGQLAEADAALTGEFTEMDEFIVQDLKLDAGSEASLLQMRLEVPQLIDSVGADLISQAGAGDAGDALRLVSGATVSDNKAVIRGLPDRYVNSQLNSVRMPSADAETRALELDQFPSAVIESVQVSKTFTPDQQGDASGGAVNIVLKGIPDQDIFEIGVGTSYNTNTTGNSDFLTYDGGGTNFLGVDRGRRNLPPIDPSAVTLGTTRDDAPYNYSTDLTWGKRFTSDNGWTVGGLVNLFYDHDADFYDDGVDAEYASFLVDPDGGLGTYGPQRFFLPDVGGFSALQAPDTRDSNVFDVIKGTEQVQWGGLGTFGVENEFNQLSVMVLHTRTTQDTAVIAQDTRSRGIVTDAIDGLGLTPIEKIFGSIADPDTSGSDLAFTRNQTLQYQERIVQTIQFHGEHTLPLFEEPAAEDDAFTLLPPVLDWTYAFSKAELREPDQRVFRSFYNPDSPGQDVFATNFDASFTGYAQRSWETITEDSDQYAVNLKLPFELPNNEEGYLKLGLFNDAVIRTFDRETYTTENGVQVPPSVVLPGGTSFEDFLLTDFLTDPEKRVNFADITNDVDFRGNYDITAFYWMLEVPVTERLRLIGGLRFETTEIGINLTNIDDEARAVSADGSVADPLLDPGGNRTIDPLTGLPRGDVDFAQDDILPAISFIYDATEKLTLRGAFSQTVARMTFRELSPIRQQEFLGSEQFFGNQSLRMSAIDNYDLRVDYRPTPGGLISGSVFYKQITDPIEYVRAGNVSFGGFTLPVNFPEGTIKGFEIELRQDMEEYFEDLAGLSLGANMTYIDSQVQVNDNQVTAPIGQTSRPMLNAPEYLINLFAVYQFQDTGTEMGLFYTLRGDTLVGGASAALNDTDPFRPNIFETEYDTLNFTISQKLGRYFKLKFSAKNLTDPDIQRVYRSSLTPETVQGSHSKGIDFSISLTAGFEF